MKASRTQKSITNTVVSIVSQFILVLLGILSRRVLIYSVGVEYLGINGLMSNILTIFSLAESGIGLAIGYALYKPLAENDIEQIKSLMRVFKYTYRALAAGTAVVGIVFYPFLPFFLKGNTAPDANIIYLMFLFSSVVSYLWVYKTTLNTSDQNKYLYTIANTISQIAVLVLKILVLHFTQNYILYLSVDIGTTVIKNLIFCRIVDRRYPYLKDKNVRKLEPSVRSGLIKNIKALFLGKVGYIVSQCSDNLVISSLVSVTAVGMYSNYTTLVTSVSGFVTTFSGGVTASMGNLIASESKQRTYEVYKRVDFINYWLYTFSAVCLLCLMEPFVAIWLGQDFVLTKGVLLLTVALYYLKGINSGIDIAKNAAGLYHPDRFVPILEAVTNLVISVILAKRYAVAGVLFGTLVSFLAFSFWTKPYFVCRDVFGIPFGRYVVGEGKKIAVAVLIALITWCAVSSVSLNNGMLSFCLKALLALALSNGLLALIYCRTEDFKYIRALAESMVNRLRRSSRENDDFQKMQ